MPALSACTTSSVKTSGLAALDSRIQALLTLRERYKGKWREHQPLMEAHIGMAGRPASQGSDAMMLAWQA